MKYRVFLYEKNNSVSSDSLICLSARECRQAFAIDEGTELVVKRSPLGKPYFEGNPLYVSLSHTENKVILVIADFPVGIDLEKEERALPSEKMQHKLGKKHFSPAENAEIARGKISFLEMWVKKEAAVKLTGDGLSGMKSTDTENSNIVCLPVAIPGFICYIAAYGDIAEAECKLYL